MISLDRREFLLASAATALFAGRASAGDPIDLLLTNGRIATLDPARPQAEALAVRGGRIVAVGSTAEVLALRVPSTQVIDLRGRTAIPGLHDSHQHPIRAGLSYNLELRWDGIATLAEAMERLRVQAKHTPPPQWVRVVGGFTAFQFREGRLPTLDELNAAAPETPVFVLHLYDRALLNRAALRALGFAEDVARVRGRLRRARREGPADRAARRAAGGPDPLRARSRSRRGSRPRTRRTRRATSSAS